MSQISDNVNYKVQPMHNGKYRLRRVPLNNITGSSIALSATATTLAEFKIPAGQVFNPARSFIDYQIEIPKQGAGNHIWAYEDTFEICNAIQFCTASGMYLTDLQFANNYVAAARKLDTKLDDFLASDFSSGLHAPLASQLTTNYFPPQVSAPGANNVYGVTNAIGNVALTPQEPQYARVGADDGAMVLGRSVPLSALTRTALAMDRDMIFGEDMYIRIQVAPSSKVGYIGTAAANPATGAAPFGAGLLQPVVNNLYLHLAHQVDPVLEASVRAKFLSGGLSFIVPYVYGWRTATVGATTSSIQIQLTNTWGKRLKRMLHVPFAPAESLNRAYDHENINGSKIIQYQTALDSQPLQDYQLSCKQPLAGGARGMDDWQENSRVAKGSVIQNSAPYYLNWFHCDSWSNPSSKVLTPHENILEGLDLSMPRSWTFTSTNTGNLTHYTFGEFIREVHSRPTGLEIVVA